MKKLKEKIESLYKSNKTLFNIVIALVILILLFNLFYLINIKGGLSSSPEDYSYYGSYIGGVIGPYITLVSVIILYLTLQQQRKTNEKQNLDSQIDKFESRFMMMLKLHRDNVAEMKIIKINSSDNPIEGRRVFVSLFEEWRLIMKTTMKEIYANDFANEKEALNISYKCLFFGLKDDSSKSLMVNDDIADRIRDAKYYQSNRDSIKENYGYMPFDGCQDLLGHYFRHLWQTVNYINTFNFFDAENDNLRERSKYAKILRGQLSNHEQAMLALNALSDLGNKAWMKKRYKKLNNEDKISLLEYYELIKNIPEGFINYEVEGIFVDNKIKHIDITEYFNIIFDWEESE